jgi:response regulator RpfG family c-di-GMP phosphodiesterase
MPGAPATDPVRRVLIVDDEEDIRGSLQDLIESSVPNTRCYTAARGAEALALLDEKRVDLIVSDFKMPGMDGIEFLTKAGRAAPHVPRVLITAFPDLQVAVRAINEAGIENFFTKPLDPGEIVKVIAETLDARDQAVQRERALARALSVAKYGGVPGA